LEPLDPANVGYLCLTTDARVLRPEIPCWSQIVKYRPRESAWSLTVLPKMESVVPNLVLKGFTHFRVVLYQVRHLFPHAFPNYLRFRNVEDRANPLKKKLFIHRDACPQALCFVAIDRLVLFYTFHVVRMVPNYTERVKNYFCLI
jgi:hypothetical protein